jgi:hypothetical protein
MIAARGVGHRVRPNILDHEHRGIAAKDRKKRISSPFGILVRNIEAELIAIKGNSIWSVAHNEKWRDAV